MKKNTSPHIEKVQFLGGNAKRTVRQLTILTIWIMIIVWISSCGPVGTATVTPPPITDAPTTPPPITEPPTTPPPAEQSCTGGDGKFTCNGLDHTVAVSNVPEGFKPNMIPLTKGEAEALRNADREGTECIFVVVGNLAFYDKDNNLILEPTFDSPVLITYTFTDQDMQAYQECQKTVIQSRPELAETKFEPVPVYFFEKGDKKVWKPFKDGTFKVEGNGTVSIEFTSWGDQQVGGGTRP